MNARLNQKQLSEIFYQINGKSRQKTELFVKNFFEIIEEELLKGEQVKVKGLGVFKTVKVEARESVNVNTGERIKIDGYVKISFTPDAALKEIINKPFAAFETMVLSDFQAEMISKSLEETVGDQVEDQDLEDAVSVPEVAEEEVVEVQETEESVAEIEPEFESETEEIEEEPVAEPESEQEPELEQEPEPEQELELENEEIEEEPVVEEKVIEEEQVEAEIEEEKPETEVVEEPVAEPESEHEPELEQEPESETEEIVEQEAEVVEEEPVIEEEVIEEEQLEAETEAEVVAESAEEQEMVKEPEAEVVEEPIVEPEPVVELEPVVEQEPIAEPESIEETTTKAEGEVVENKQNKKNKKHIGLRAVIILASVILSLLLLVYMLWPVIFRQYIKHQYKTSRNEVVTEQVTTQEPIISEQQNVLEGSADNSTETPVETTVATPVPAKPVSTVSETKPIVETKPAAASNTIVKQSIKLVAEDENRDLADITADDTDNYEIVGLLAEHTLKKDEILTILSQKYYGTKKLWPYIAKYNNFDDFNKLRPGMKILIPKLENK
jgi:nucleoid DNA-binding protein